MKFLKVVFICIFQVGTKVFLLEKKKMFQCCKKAEANARNYL
jgi:hypothetical protein